MVSEPGASAENRDEIGLGVQFPHDALSDLSDPSKGLPLGESERESDFEDSTVDIVGRAAVSNLPSDNHIPHQHASLFYLSLIEGRCRTQATNLVNARRHPENQLSEDHSEVYKVAERLFAEMSKELLKAGLLPQRVGVAVPTFHELRRYLASFDTILNDIAIKQPPGTFDDSAYRAIEDSNPFSFGLDAVSSLFERSQSQSHALVAQRVNMSSLIPPQAGLGLSPFQSVMFPVGRDGRLQMSPYDTKFRELSLLGKGGFGKVYRVLHIVDNQEYAIKQLRVSASQLQSSLRSEARKEELLLELRALAKLQHNNVVRYFDSWLEARPVSENNMTQDQRLLGSKSYTSGTGGTSSESDESSRQPAYAPGGLTTEFPNIQASQEIELRKEAKKARRDSLLNSTNDNNIVFENSSPSTSNPVREAGTPLEPKPTYINKLFRSPTDDGSDDDDEVTEEVERETSALQSQDDKELMIFIQMAQYPMTLEEFIWAELKNRDAAECPEHCFHTPMIARILLAILDGIEYIHSQHIVHRDLKPSNIFLSVFTTQAGPEGSINLKRCPECGPSSPDEHLSIIPHIGDFGLIAKLDVSSPVQPPREGFHPSPLAIISSMASGQPGTKFYCAPRTANSTICPKLDVYSLGVIALELTMKFGTKSERLSVLSNLSKGVLPAPELADHPMALGIRGMLCVNASERWDCGKVRRWLVDILGKY